MRAGWFYQSRSDLNRLQGNVGRRQASREALGQPGESHRQFVRSRPLSAGIWQRRPGSHRRACLKFWHKRSQPVPWAPGETLQQSIEAAQVGGRILMIGVLSGFEQQIAIPNIFGTRREALTAPCPGRGGSLSGTQNCEKQPHAK